MNNISETRSQQLVNQNDSFTSYDASVLAAFPPGTFLENIAVDEQGVLYITSLDEGIVYKITTAGEVSVFGKTAGKLAGILMLNNSFILNGWNDQGFSTIYAMEKSGIITQLHNPLHAQFLNGMVAMSKTKVLVCDSYKGCILLYDLQTNHSSIWLSHPLLSKIDMQNQFMPAANGIKIHDGSVYVSNTERKLLLTIPLVNENAGEPVVFMDDVNLDDFAIDPLGNVYASTHILNTVVKIAPDKQLHTIAGESQGLAGSTAVAFGRTDGDKDYLYVTTNGGMSLPFEGVVQSGRVVKIRFR